MCFSVCDCLYVRSSNDEGSQFSKFRFLWNKEEKLVSNSFFREYSLYLEKTLNPFKFFTSQLFLTSLHFIFLN